MVAPKGNNILCPLIAGFFFCLGFGYYLIGSSIKYLYLSFWIYGIAMFVLALLLVHLMCAYSNYLDKRSSRSMWGSSRSDFTTRKIRQKQIKKTQKKTAQLKRAPSMIGCHVCGATYEKPVNYCEKCGAKIIKSTSDYESD